MLEYLVDVLVKWVRSSWNPQLAGYTSLPCHCTVEIEWLVATGQFAVYPLQLSFSNHSFQTIRGCLSPWNVGKTKRGNGMFSPSMWPLHVDPHHGHAGPGLPVDLWPQMGWHCVPIPYEYEKFQSRICGISTVTAQSANSLGCIRCTAPFLVART